MFANGLGIAGGMLFMRSSVTCENYSLSLFANYVRSVITVLSVLSLIVGNIRLGFVIWLKVFYIDLESMFEIFYLFEW